MLAAALQAEVDAYIEQFAGLRDENGRRLVVRNGTAEPRTVLTSAGAVEVTAPRVNDKRADPARASGCGSPRRSCRRGRARPRRSARCCRCCTCTACRQGTSCPRSGSSSAPAGPVVLDDDQADRDWNAEAAAFMTRDLSQADYVYVWADGIHLNIRLDEGKLCLLVMIGVRIDGRKELIALADGYRESAESWADLLRDCARRGMRAPVLAVGDGALGFWSRAPRSVPAGREPALLVP